MDINLWKAAQTGKTRTELDWQNRNIVPLQNINEDAPPADNSDLPSMLRHPSTPQEAIDDFRRKMAEKKAKEAKPEGILGASPEENATQDMVSPNKQRFSEVDQTPDGLQQTAGSSRTTDVKGQVVNMTTGYGAGAKSPNLVTNPQYAPVPKMSNPNR
jgi:hypothetical protein